MGNDAAGEGMGGHRGAQQAELGDPEVDASRSSTCAASRSRSARSSASGMAPPFSGPQQPRLHTDPLPTTSYLVSSIGPTPQDIG